jgi:hypothetical protein
MVQVCERTTTKNDMLQMSLDQYKHMYIIARREFDKVATVGLATRSHSAWKLMLSHRVLGDTLVLVLLEGQEEEEEEEGEVVVVVVEEVEEEAGVMGETALQAEEEEVGVAEEEALLHVVEVAVVEVVLEAQLLPLPTPILKVRVFGMISLPHA